MRKIFIIVFSLFMLTSCSTSPDSEDYIGGDVVAVTTPEPTPEPTPTPTPEPTLSPAEIDRLIAESEAELRRDAVAYAREQGLYTYEDLAVAYYDLENMYDELEYENDELWDENEELHDDIDNYRYNQ